MTAIDCHALCVDLASAPATVTSRLYQGMNSDSASTSPPSTASTPHSRGQPVIELSLRAQAAATAAPDGSSKRAATSSRMPSIASVAGER